MNMPVELGLVLRLDTPIRQMLLRKAVIPDRGPRLSDEFRRQAVDLCRSHSGATVRGIADDLGIERGTLRHWLDAFGTAKTTATASLTRGPLKPAAADTVVRRGAPEREVPGSGPGGAATTRPRSWSPKPILRRADEYFAGERLVDGFQCVTVHQGAPSR